jgi:fumarate hydratase class II
LEINEHLLPSLRRLHDVIRTRSIELDEVIKNGRTHLMDAMPLTFGQELGGWAAQINHAILRIESVLPRLRQLAQGATAVGTGVNADPQLTQLFAEELSRHTDIEFKPADNPFAALSSQDTAVELSGQLRTLAVSLMKIANDLRWMNSGPLTGLGEIMLPPLQPGSSIMPGKVNPVIPESVAMACAQVMGNDITVAVAGQSGNFQLNVMLPVIAYNLLQSIELLGNSATALAQNAIAGFSVNRKKLAEQLDRNPVLATALNNVVGYEKSAAIAKQAYKEGKSISEVAAMVTDLPPEELERLLDPANLVRPQ